ncbi:hypothetical protein HXX76_016029 [Chlamydomonas incerta]|uniref:Uncharacterized protein n=1 Tax=Chlamydomonas incerta TaxID=51695 RepID=A0A835VR47_CHLIN|nr:hypothetical protein HXX76_016029 [Chlamydomonas incerta]|eukprot:KAG2422459.1 hypothetical protein HXX76_016029 [Chlamydomonas incerta]
MYLLSQRFKRERSKYYNDKFESASMGDKDPRSYLAELRKCEQHATDLSKRRVVSKFFEGLPTRLRERVLSTVPQHDDLADLYGQLTTLANTAHLQWSLMLDMGQAAGDTKNKQKDKPASASATTQAKGDKEGSPRGGKKYCELHGENFTHSTKECRVLGNGKRTAAATASTSHQPQTGNPYEADKLYKLLTSIESRLAAASASSGGGGGGGAASGAPRTKHEADKAKRENRNSGPRTDERCEYCFGWKHAKEKCPLVDPDNAPHPDWEPRIPALKAVYQALKAQKAQEKQRKAAVTAHEYAEEEEDDGEGEYGSSCFTMLIREPARECHAGQGSSSAFASNSACGIASGGSAASCLSGTAQPAPPAHCDSSSALEEAEMLLSFNRMMARLTEQKPVNILMPADSGTPVQSAYATLRSQPTPVSFTPAPVPSLPFEAPRANKPTSAGGTTPSFSVNVNLSGSATSILSRLSLLMQPDIPPAPNEPIGAVSSAGATAAPSAAATSSCVTQSFPVPGARGHYDTYALQSGVSYVVAGEPTDGCKPFSALSARERAIALAANPEARSYMLNPHLMFYFAKDVLAVDGVSFVVLRDHCADVNLISEAAAAKRGFKIKPSHCSLTTGNQQKTAVLGE